MIPKVTARAGAGSSLVTEGEVLGMYAFRSDFLHRVGIHAKYSVMMDVLGQSMEPLIRDRDIHPRGPVFPGAARRRNLSDRLRGRTARQAGAAHRPRWLLRSENRDYADIVVEGPDLENFRVYGRVRWFGRVI